MDIILADIKKDALVFKKIHSKQDLKEEKLDGYLIESDEKEVRRIIDTLKAKGEKKILAVVGKNDEFNRRIIETCKVQYLVSPEFSEGKDTLKQRDSGLNHVSAKAAAKKNISIVINFSEIEKLDKKSKAIVLSRIMQNLIVCRKAGCKIKIASFASNEKEFVSEYDLRAFLFSLGASSQQVSEAFEF